MARSTALDFLQAHPFWLMDIPQAEALAAPMLTPLMGFATCSSPEMTADVMTIKECNWPFPRKVVKGATVNTLSLTRGSTFIDSDFWRWMLYSVTGSSMGWYGETFGGNTPRRDLLLIQYFTHASVAYGIAGGLIGGLLAGGAGAIAEGGGPGALAASLKGVASFGTSIGGQMAVQAMSPGPFEVAIRIPAKAWIIHGAVPSRYKAGSDFDARSAEVSLLELDLEYESFEEYSVSA
jgi:hypothetical protein